MREFRLQTWLILLLATAVILTFTIVGSAILIFRLPQVEMRGRAQAQTTAEGVAKLLDQFIGGVEDQLHPLTELMAGRTVPELQAHLDAIVADGATFNAISVADVDGTVLAVGLPRGRRAAVTELRGADLSANRLFLKLRRDIGAPEGNPVQWSDRYLSILSGTTTVGVALHAGRYTVIGELSPARLLDMLRSFSVTDDVAVMVIDAQGWRLATSNTGPKKDELKHYDFSGLPSFRAIVAQAPLPEYEILNGKRLLVGGVMSAKLGWVIGAAIPAGWDNYSYRTTIILVAIGFLASLLISLSLAPFWASRMARPVRGLIDHAHRIAASNYPESPLHRGPVGELNQLAWDLDLMGRAIREREEAMGRSEERLAAIFNASPAPMTVSDANNHYRLLDANAAWELQFARERSAVTGLNGAEMGLWAAVEDRQNFLDLLVRDGAVKDLENWLVTGDGRRLLCRISALVKEIGHSRLLLMMAVDVTEQRHIEQEIRDLNVELEERVTLRTEELSHANEELEATVDSLKATQEELVQSAKLAALGDLVSGVAHELNTPIGNGLMAVSTLADRLAEFRAGMAAGLRRSVLEEFLASVQMASDIGSRNLHRAADLIASFKQLAVDQASSQRRHFELAEVLHEVLMTMQPTLKRTPFQIVTNVPEGLQFDSFPGPLGQVLANLINNAVIHGFEGRVQGSITIEASATTGNQVRLVIRDDGNGIPAELQSRIFEPFYTTRLGRGGSGLGLHIVFNAVTAILGGSISLSSHEAEGTTFTLLLPRQAPASSPTQKKT